MNLWNLIPLFIEIAWTGMHFDFKKQELFSIIDLFALLLPTQIFKVLKAGDKHKKRRKITFQFLNNLQRNDSNFPVG